MSIKEKEEYKRGDLVYCEEDEFGNIGFYGKDLKLMEMDWKKVDKVPMKSEETIKKWLTQDDVTYALSQREGLWVGKKGNETFEFRVCPTSDCEKCNWIPITNVKQDW